MATKKASATKTTAKKAAASGGSTPTTAKKSVAKQTDAPAATRVDDRAPDSPPIPATSPVPSADEEITKVAKQILRGNRRWGTGRERDERLAKAGHNVEAVRREVYRLRAEEASNNR